MFCGSFIPQTLKRAPLIKKLHSAVLLPQEDMGSNPSSTIQQLSWSLELCCCLSLGGGSDGSVCGNIYISQNC